MNTLTPNRILKEGDEYRKNGTWLPVPKDDYGLQIMFTKYAEVRRPSEKAISPDGGASVPAVKAEKVNVPAPTPSGAGATPAVLKQLDRHGLPTVVSKKAHLLVRHEDGKPIFKEPTSTTPTPKPVVLSGTTETRAGITWHSKLEPECRWIGRNGTFKCRGVNLEFRKQGTIAVLPVGARGEAKNAEIEFPVNAIPQVIDFLQKHLTPK
jgi:hypothetical protein